jgi:hypothetical protein
MFDHFSFNTETGAVHISPPQFKRSLESGFVYLKYRDRMFLIEATELEVEVKDGWYYIGVPDTNVRTCAQTLEEGFDKFAECLVYFYDKLVCVAEGNFSKEFKNLRRQLSKLIRCEVDPKDWEDYKALDLVDPNAPMTLDPWNTFEELDLTEVKASFKTDSSATLVVSAADDRSAPHFVELHQIPFSSSPTQAGPTTPTSTSTSRTVSVDEFQRVLNSTALPPELARRVETFANSIGLTVTPPQVIVQDVGSWTVKNVLTGETVTEKDVRS